VVSCQWSVASCQFSDRKEKAISIALMAFVFLATGN